MVEVASNHFAQLLDCILHDVSCGLTGHASEGVWTPGGNLGLQENAVPVAVVENTLVLGPMNAGEDAVQMFHICMVVSDPLGWLCHAELRIAPRHAFHAHQSHTFAIEEECAIPNLKLAYAEDRCEGVPVASVRDGKLEAVKMRMIKVP